MGHCYLYPLHSWQDILLTSAEMELDSTTMFPPGTSVMFIRSTGEPFLAQVVGHSEHGDAYRRITYDHDGKTVLHDRVSVRRLSLPRAPSMPRMHGGGAVPQGGVGDRHLVTVPQGVVGDRLPWGGERQGGGGVLQNTVRIEGCPGRAVVLSQAHTNMGHLVARWTNQFSGAAVRTMPFVCFAVHVGCSNGCGMWAAPTHRWSIFRCTVLNMCAMGSFRNNDLVPATFGASAVVFARGGSRWRSIPGSCVGSSPLTRLISLPFFFHVLGAWVCGVASCCVRCMIYAQLR